MKFTKNNLLKIYIWLLIFSFCVPIFLAQAATQTQPFELFLSWSSNTYTPFEYSGKALPVYGSIIKVVVAPLSKPNVNLETLEYNWFLDGEPQTVASGINQQEFLFQVKKTNNDSHSVQVNVQNQDNTFVRQFQK